MTWYEDEATVTRMMQFADECVETKTVTTTTTTKRSYPPLFLREPRDLHSLDSKEYPLAGKPTPSALRKLTFDLDDYDPEGWDDEDEADAQVGARRAFFVFDSCELTRAAPRPSDPRAPIMPATSSASPVSRAPSPPRPTASTTTRNRPHGGLEGPPRGPSRRATRRCRRGVPA